MNSFGPVSDIVCSLLETPFSRWKDEDKKDLLITGRPTSVLTLSAKKDIKKSGKSYNIHFKHSWFSEYKWLCSSGYFQKMFCWPCLLFCHKHSAWNKDGFADLLNVTRSFHRHADSVEHLKCELMLRNFEKNTNTIADALKENARLFKKQFNENVRLNRLIMERVINTVFFLGKQELAFRGHDETTDSVNRGNFKELLHLLISTSPSEIQNQYEKIKNIFKGDSKSIQNEVIDCISDYLNEAVKNEMIDAIFFSLQVDDTTDLTQTSQCSVIVRFVNTEGILVERFLGFHDVSADRTSESLYNMIDKILDPFDYKTKLVGQCYDGASVMSGHLNGLQMKFKEKAPQAVFVHCLAHRLNLVLQQSFKKISKCRIFFANLGGIPSFFHHSAKRSYALTLKSARRIPTVTETRWSSNSKLLDVIVQDWDKLKEVFEFIIHSEESDQKSIRLATGFLGNMNDFEFTFLALVFNDIFSATNILFDILQKKSLDINYCLSQINSTSEILRNKRNENVFNPIFEKANNLTQINMFKRQYSGLNQNDICARYRVLFYEILDHILIEMDTRFQDCEKLKFVCLGDSGKFEQYSSNFPSDALENLQTFYANSFTKNARLKNELSLLYSNESLRNVSLQELLKKLNENKDIFLEAYKLLCLILTIPSTSVSVERSFSCLKRIKTYSRNTIAQDRLSSLANISIQKELLEELKMKVPFYDDIIDKYAGLKNRRIDLIYKK